MKRKWWTVGVAVLVAGAVVGGWLVVQRQRRLAASSAPLAEAPSRTPASAPTGGPALAPLQLSPQRLQQIGVTTGVVARVPASLTLRVTGNVAVAENRLAFVQLRYTGWIRRVFVASTYTYVHRGQPLFSIYSPELAVAERDYLLARQTANRLANSSVPEVAGDARALLAAAQQRLLQQYALPAEEMERLERTGQPADEIVVRSPLSGWVVERQALPNLYVQPETKLYTLADLSVIWVFAEVFQTDLGAVRPGLPAEITVDSYPGRTFRGRVDLVYPQVDEATRTARLRLVLPNPQLLLKPGMYADVALRIAMGRQLVVPSDAVLATGTQNIVFVDRGGGVLEPRSVQLGQRVDQGYVVLRGLQPGERIVTSANFLLDAESQLQAALGSYLPPPPGAGSAAAMNVPRLQVEFATVPSPPRRGANELSVVVRDETGRPIGDAQVAVVFSMAAMPEMGMPAMRQQAELAAVGDGRYRGRVELPTGGTWQVTVVVRRGSQVLATRQWAVNVTGGM